MSFRVFVYYCAICGGWAALCGWRLGLTVTPSSDLGIAGMRGMALGFAVAFGLSLLDSVWNLGVRQFVVVVLRVLVAVVVGAIGGLIGGILGQALLDVSQIFFVVGWTLAGTLIGASIGSYEFLDSIVKKRNLRGSSGKILKCLIGGTVGGILGGILAYVLKFLVSPALFPSKNPNELWTPTSWGFVALGMCIGLLVGLAQIFLKEAWIKVEQGFRAGREMILVKERTSVGRAEGSDIALFGDMGIEKLHANIIMNGSQYFLEDANAPGGTFVNDVKVDGRAPLKSGDLIRVGKALLRFYEKPKKSAG